MAREPWTTAADGIVLDVRLTPRGGRDALEGIEVRADGRVVVKARVRAPPADGAANAALCRLVANAAGVPARNVAVESGGTARLKRIRIKGDSAALVKALRGQIAADP